MSYLSHLNPQQLEAVEHFKGPILVLAGAGSGKTRVLTHRVANLVLKHKVRPESILAVTFTNKATEEMRGRLRGLLGESAESLWASTFHSAALRILRRHASLIGYSNNFVVYDEDDSKALMREVLRACDLNEKQNPPKLFLRIIDRAKNQFVTPEDFARQSRAGAGGLAHQIQAEVYDYYQKALMRANAMDFGDLLVNAVRVFKEFPDVLSQFQRRIEFVLVDEFQDTNTVQYLWVRLLTQLHKNLLVVGDDDQSIYAFRGATIRNILDFERDFPDTKVIKLEQNYRSTSNILNAAHGVIEKNRGRKAKKLWTANKSGSPIFMFEGEDEMEEAEFVVKKIKWHRAQGGAYTDVAVFYRTNAQSRALEEQLVYEKIPYRIYGGLKFYDRKEIKDILAYIRLLVNPKDNQAFLRTINTPTRGIGAQTVKEVVERARIEKISLLEAANLFKDKNKGIKRYCELLETLTEKAHKLFLPELVAQVVELTEYGAKLRALEGDVTAQSRLENLLELEVVAQQHIDEALSRWDNVAAFLDRITLTAGNELPVEEAKDAKAAPADTVSLMTLHLAKGLEFPLVFLTGMEEGLLPHYKCLEDPGGLEEERRLCYVGITRAMKELYLTRANDRGLFSAGTGFGGMYRSASRFLLDIPQECTEYLHYESEINEVAGA